MRHILENLINEADAIKRSTTVKRDFAAFNSRLRDVAKELELECQDAEITERLQSLLDYETYDELSKPGKMFRWVLAYEFSLYRRASSFVVIQSRSNRYAPLSFQLSMKLSLNS